MRLREKGTPPVSETELQLIRQLFRFTPPTLLSSFVVACIVYFTLRGSVPETPLDIWMFLFGVVILMRFTIFQVKRRKEYSPEQCRFIARFYSVGAFIAGCQWASLIFFYDSSLVLQLQLLILVVLIGLPVAAMPADSIYLPVYYSFAVPIISALVYWSLFMADKLNIQFAAISIAFSVVVFLTARMYHGNLREMMDVRIRNHQLLENLSEANQRLEKLAYLDPLTGLANRRWFEVHVEAALARAHRHNTQFALMLIDLDNFKQVNDSFGHEAGDKFLLSIVKRLKHALRTTDTVIQSAGEIARFGGDEFTVLLEEVSGDLGVDRACQRILEALSKPLDIEGVAQHPSASVGVALFPDHGTDVAQLIRRADSAMYEAKKRGGNRCCLYGSEEADRLGAAEVSVSRFG